MIKLVTTCAFLRVYYKVVLTRLSQSWYINIATTLCCQPCGNLVLSWLYQTCQTNLAASQIMPSWQLVPNLLQQTRNNLWTNSLQLVYRLVTSCPFHALILSVWRITLPNISTITFSHEEFMFVLVYMLEISLYADKVHMKNNDFLETVYQVFDWEGARGEHNQGLTLCFPFWF